jgi:hypothetical protein
LSTTSNIVAKVEALIARAVQSPYAEEARTSAMVAAKLIAEHGLLSGVVIVKEVERVVVPISIEEIRSIIRDHQRERARKGGEARAAKLSAERRSEIASKAAGTPRPRKET